MGIDYGESRIGLALSDPLLTFAYSYKTIKNDKDLWKNIIYEELAARATEREVYRPQSEIIEIDSALQLQLRALGYIR